MSETASISTGIANRYATAVYELAQEAKTLPKIENDLDVLKAAGKIADYETHVINISKGEQVRTHHFERKVAAPACACPADHASSFLV